mmetsp:Transcript_35894/g.79924  ORF Transcript_35894/g.79924 Transcript_35894/m.79924 type:complete len:212 (-) Transcript_35894:554-1189(-)
MVIACLRNTCSFSLAPDCMARGMPSADMPAGRSPAAPLSRDADTAGGAAPKPPACCSWCLASRPAGPPLPALAGRMEAAALMGRAAGFLSAAVPTGPVLVDRGRSVGGGGVVRGRRSPMAKLWRRVLLRLLRATSATGASRPQEFLRESTAARYRPTASDLLPSSWLHTPMLLRQHAALRRAVGSLLSRATRSARSYAVSNLSIAFSNSPS